MKLYITFVTYVCEVLVRLSSFVTDLFNISDVFRTDFNEDGQSSSSNSGFFNAFNEIPIVMIIM